jgi:hypothetical protein
MTPGRSCPLSYRYGPQALATAPVRQAQTLYVVGGLYGNVPALDALDALLAQETGPVTVCFNGDFNWFNVDADMLREVNTRVLQHDAIAGNVEAELCTALDDAGCGCAYPDSVDAQVVERSNRIHARLKAALHKHPDLRERLSSLPMFARYDVAGLRVAVVHGDAESLAGWGFDHAALTDKSQDAWLSRMFAQAQVDVFASSHTCVPVLKDMGGVVINNGAAGMPNFAGRKQGLITRISAQPSPHALYGVCKESVNKEVVHIQALPLAYDAKRWEQDFLKQWPPGSDAHVSYFARIQGHLSFEPEQALA